MGQQVRSYMGKKRGSNVPSSASRATNQAMSLREEISGKTQADTASLLRVQHLQRLAAWASVEAGVAPIGALLGHCLSVNAEAGGIPLGASTFLCQRCESVLQPGFNFTIRLKNNKRKGKRCKKSNSSHNRVAYACHFCGDQNIITGTGKGIVKSLLSSRKSASMDTISKKSKGDSWNRATVATKEGLEHSLAAVSLVKSSSVLKPLTVEKDEHMDVSKPNVREDSKMEERVVSSTCRLAAATIQEGITKEIVAESTNDKCMSEIELVSSEKTRLCEPKVSLQAEFLAGSKFVTQKNKLSNTSNPKGSAEVLKTRSTQNRKGESSGSITGKALASSSKSSGPGKKTKSALGDSAQVSGGSRKRARKGWTMIKQIADKDELERKEKMGSSILPLYNGKYKSHLFHGAQRESITVFNTLSDTSTSDSRTSSSYSSGSGSCSHSSYGDMELETNSKQVQEAGPSSTATIAEGVQDECPGDVESTYRMFTDQFFVRGESSNNSLSRSDEFLTETMQQGRAPTKRMWLKRKRALSSTK